MASEVKWIKIVTDIFDDEKILLIESMPDADAIIVIWFKLLCLAGRTNTMGVLLLNERIPYNDEMLAHIFRRPLNTVRLALRTFEQYGMIEIVNNTITIPNWTKHQQLESLEKRREYQRNLMAKRRAEQKLIAEKDQMLALTEANTLADVSAPDKDIDIDIPPISPTGGNGSDDKPKKTKPKRDDAVLDQLFEAFWKEYPRKIAKQKARKSFYLINPDQGLTQKMIDAVIVQRQTEQWKKDNGQFVPYPATWLNQHRWEDQMTVEVSDEIERPYMDGDHENWGWG